MKPTDPGDGPLEVARLAPTATVRHAPENLREVRFVNEHAAYSVQGVHPVILPQADELWHNPGAFDDRPAALAKEAADDWLKGFTNGVCCCDVPLTKNFGC